MNETFMQGVAVGCVVVLAFPAAKWVAHKATHRSRKRAYMHQHMINRMKS